jgi:TPP-dependent pyruvate/acetoin dehydrogenase alpha subunit
MGERKTNGKPTLSEERFIEMQAQIKKICVDSVEFAENSPIPDVETELYSDVLVNPMPNMSPMADYVHGAKNPLL